MLTRRNFFKALGTTTAIAGIEQSIALGDVPIHRWDDYDFGKGPIVRDRINQGPFGISQDAGWCNIANTTPSTE
ncbi:MAG: hypothetical protein ACWGQW_23675, partial [bacterium]